MRILVDKDNVLADFDGYLASQLHHLLPQQPIIPRDQMIKTRFSQNYPDTISHDIASIHNSPGFVTNLPLIRDCRNNLLKLQTIGHEIIICTSPLSNNPTCQSEVIIWTRQTLDIDLPIIFSKDKTTVTGDILIDDNPNLPARSPSGWQHIIFDQPYNRHLTDRPRIMDWSEIQSVL